VKKQKRPQKRPTKQTHKTDPQKDENNRPTLQSRPTRELKMFGRKENHKRDLQKRPTKQTHKIDPQKRPTKQTHKTDPQKDEHNRPTQEMRMFCNSLTKRFCNPLLMFETRGGH